MFHLIAQSTTVPPPQYLHPPPIMDLYEVYTGSRLDVITEEVLSGDEEHGEEHQEEVKEEEVNRDLPTKEAFVVVSERTETRELSSTSQRFSTDTNDSLRSVIQHLLYWSICTDIIFLFVAVTVTQPDTQHKHHRL